MLAVPWLTARETAALIAIAVTLLFYRVFRDRCLLVWAAGWVAYGAFLSTLSGHPQAGPLRWLARFSEVDFVLAMGLFAAAVLMAAHANRTLSFLAA
jgi:hypothetical protein